MIEMKETGTGEELGGATPSPFSIEKSGTRAQGEISSLNESVCFVMLSTKTILPNQRSAFVEHA